MIVLSLFNGMNTGRQALENVGIKVEKYYSSEIKPYAIKLTQHHFPDTIQVGDVTNWSEWDIEWQNVDLLLSGSPCQDLSQAGKRAGIHGKKSSLFFVFIEIKNHINQERKKHEKGEVLFLQENVGSASKLDVGIMSRELGVYPVRINSSLVTAQLRDRYYWSNIRTKQDGMFGDLVTDIPQPQDRKIMLKDIIENGFVVKNKSNALMQSESKTYSYKDIEKFERFIYKRISEFRQICELVYQDENAYLKVKEATEKGFVEIKNGEAVDLSFPTSKTRRGRSMKEKSNCLLRTNEYYLFENNELRYFTQTELERLQGFTDGYTSILPRNQASSLLGDGWTLPIIEHILTFLKK